MSACTACSSLRSSMRSPPCAGRSSTCRTAWSTATRDRAQRRRLPRDDRRGRLDELMTMFAKRLAPVVDSSTVIEDSSDIPNSVMFLSLVGPETPTTRLRDRALAREQHHHRPLRRAAAAPQEGRRPARDRRAGGDGRDGARPARAGPHALVGGTTGAGKSEFLQAWVLGMAAAHSPDRVTFLFVDYKGGSAFADCVELPALRRARHRPEPAPGAPRAHEPARRAAPPRASSQPQEGQGPARAREAPRPRHAARARARHRRVRRARGRGARVRRRRRRHRPARPVARHPPHHGHAATGRRDQGQPARQHQPARGAADGGRVRLQGCRRRPDRRALRPEHPRPRHRQDRSRPARAVPVRVRGRVEQRRGSAPPTWSWPSCASDRRSGGRSKSEAETDAHDGDLGPNDQKRIVATLVAAAERAAHPGPAAPLARRPRDHRRPAGAAAGAAVRSCSARAMCPSASCRRRCTSNPIATARCSSTAPAARASRPCCAPWRSPSSMGGRRAENVEVYGLDFGSGSLKSLEILPHVGSIIPGDDPERLQRILRSLAKVLDDRGKRFSAANASSIREYRELTGRDEARIILLIDGLPQFRAEWEATTARMPFYQIFMRILGEGRPLGVHVVATADRSGSVPTAVSSNVSRRIVLRLADENAYALVNAPKDVLDERSAPGRAIVDGFEIPDRRARRHPQRGRADQDPREVGRRPPSARRAGGRRDRRPPDPPGRGRSSATASASSRHRRRRRHARRPRIRPGGTLRGRRSADVGQDERDEGARPVDGALRSRRQAVPLRRPALPAQGLRPVGAQCRHSDDAKDLATELAELVADESLTARIMIVIEDVPQFADSSAERAAEGPLPGREAQRAPPHRRRRHGSGHERLRPDRRLQVGPQGIALRADAFDGEALFKVPFPKVKRSDFPEGRGILVQAGRIVTVQLPLVDSPCSSSRKVLRRCDDSGARRCS